MRSSSPDHICRPRWRRRWRWRWSVEPAVDIFSSAFGTASVRLLTRDRNTRQSRGKGPDLWVTLKTGRSRRPLWYWFYAKFFANNNLQFVCGLAEELQHVAEAGKVGIWHQDLLLGVTLLDDLLHFLRGVHTTADHKGLETTVGSEVHIRLQSKREYF